MPSLRELKLHSESVRLQDDIIDVINDFKSGLCEEALVAQLVQVLTSCKLEVVQAIAGSLLDHIQPIFCGLVSPEVKWALCTVCSATLLAHASATEDVKMTTDSLMPAVSFAVQHALPLHTQLKSVINKEGYAKLMSPVHAWLDFCSGGQLEAQVRVSAGLPEQFCGARART